MALNAYQNGWDTVFVYRDHEMIVPGNMHDLIASKGVNVERPRRCYLDLEVESNGFSIQDQTMGDAPILCWAIVDDEGNTFSDICTDGWERKFIRTLCEYEQICAWNGEHYDFLVLANTVFRSYDSRRWLWLDHLKVFGRYHLVVESGAERESLALNHVAQTILGEGKHTIDLKSATIETLQNYCIQDAKLLAKLEAKTHYIDLHYNVCRICNCFPDTKSLNPTHFVDSYLSRLARQNGVPLPPRIFNEAETKYTGAYVMEPDCKGVQYDVDVIDFASMYPSVMITYNMSWETIGWPGLTVPATGVSFDISHKGIIPLALENLLALRKTYQDESSRTACKVVANSFYGVVGSPYSRYYNRSIAESVTLTSQWLIKSTREEAIKMGFKVIYADTDSNMVQGGDVAMLVRHCNEVLYPSMLPNYNNVVKIASDKHYKRIVFIAAKKYVGILDNDKPHVKGLEYKRRDTCKIARDFQKQVVDCFANFGQDQDYIRLVENYYATVMSGQLSIDDIKLSKRLNKPIEEYKNKPPHVRLAERMNIKSGDRVEFIVTNGRKSPLQISDNGRPDRVYYWNKVIYPPTYRLLKAIFPEKNWDIYFAEKQLCLL